ncbi:hypothetical protein [Gallaecimonas sp. GXIMD4217]|uniref:PKD domain-containing protein n=1 Tax=Gallaecimonas sp. GXIMD4217 TaxID=3131927 RepID=UPI00311ADD70
MRRLDVLALSVATALLTACGGGGGGGDTSLPTNPGTPTYPPVAELTLSGDTQVQQGQAVGLVAQVPAGTYRSFQWTRLSGPDVDDQLLSANSKAIGFDALEAGNYSFRFTATRADGSTLTADHDLAVAGHSGAQLQLRVDRAISEGAQTSFRLGWNDTTLTGLSWSQLSGPEAKLEVNQEEPVLFVTAPQVTGDQVVVLQATATTSGGETLTEQVHLLVEDKAEITSPYFDTPLTTVHAYKADSPYADVLRGCVYSNQITDSNACYLSKLPAIGMDTETPSVADIMDRVVVSHDWMGERFERFLTELDPNDDFKNLLRATSAIVISHDVRPSFYWALTGAIYLDADNLWLTPTERDLINEQPDYRSNFGNDLQFIMPWRYVKQQGDGSYDYAFRYWDPAARQTRSFEELEADLGSLLYHELAHANDFMPKSKWQTVSMNQEFWRAAVNGQIVSEDLTAQDPLLSQNMKDLAKVSFHGETATAAQKGYTPNDVANFFAPDKANAYYSYSSTREDLAMAFEELMMDMRYGIERDQAVTELAESRYRIAWGQRGRMGDADIKPRIQFAVDNLLPEVRDAALNHLAVAPAPTQMPTGVSWFDALDIDTSNTGQLRAAKAPVMERPIQTGPRHPDMPLPKR